jgi:hypothetical protein
VLDLAFSRFGCVEIVTEKIQGSKGSSSIFGLRSVVVVRRSLAAVITSLLMSNHLNNGILGYGTV